MKIIDREVCLIVVEGVATGGLDAPTAAALASEGHRLIGIDGSLVAIDSAVIPMLTPAAAPSVAAPMVQPPPTPTPATTPPLQPARRHTERAALSLNEAGQMVGVSGKTLDRQRQLGKLKCLRLGRQWRVTVAEVHAFLRRNA